MLAALVDLRGPSRPRCSRRLRRPARRAHRGRRPGDGVGELAGGLPGPGGGGRRARRGGRAGRASGRPARRRRRAPRVAGVRARGRPARCRPGRHPVRSRRGDVGRSPDRAGARRRPRAGARHRGAHVRADAHRIGAHDPDARRGAGVVDYPLTGARIDEPGYPIRSASPFPSHDARRTRRVRATPTTSRRASPTSSSSSTPTPTPPSSARGWSRMLRRLCRRVHVVVLPCAPRCQTRSPAPPSARTPATRSAGC